MADHDDVTGNAIDRGADGVNQRVIARIEPRTPRCKQIRVGQGNHRPAARLFHGHPSLGDLLSQQLAQAAGRSVRLRRDHRVERLESDLRECRVDRLGMIVEARVEVDEAACQHDDTGHRHDPQRNEAHDRVATVLDALPAR